MSRTEMNSDQKTATEGAEHYVSKSGKKKLQLIHFSKGSNIPLQTAVAYASTSTNNKIPKNINWHESQWPELPKSGFPSQPDSKLKDLPLVGSSSSDCESSSKEASKNSNKTELARKCCDKTDCVLNCIQDDEMVSLQTAWNHFTFKNKQLEEVTCSFTALNMTNKFQEVAVIKNPENAHLQQTYLERKLPRNRRKEKKFKAKVVFSSCEEVEETSLLQDNQSTLCDEEFPDLLTIRKFKRGKTKNSPSVENLIAEIPTKKYPKKNDPIFINLGQVLENSFSSRDCKNLLERHWYSREFLSGKPRNVSSQRAIKRGKQREFPPRKTLTKLKLAILRGRQKRLQSRIQSSRTLDHSFITDSKIPQSSNSSQPISSHDDCQGKETILYVGRLFGSWNDGGSQNDSDVEEIDCRTCVEIGESGKIQRNLNLCPGTEQTHCVDEIVQLAKSSIHSRKFREYCNNDNCTSLQEKVKSFVKQIYRFQTKSHFRDSEKARIHRRYALGLREADKFFKLGKLKVLIIATDLEANSEEGGLDEIIGNMKSRACKENLPIIFALKRRDLAYCVYRKVPVSCMAVLNYEGAEKLYHAMMDSWREALVAYDNKLKHGQQSILSQGLKKPSDVLSAENPKMFSSVHQSEEDTKEVEIVREKQSINQNKTSACE